MQRLATCRSRATSASKAEPDIPSPHVRTGVVAGSPEGGSLMHARVTMITGGSPDQVDQGIAEFKDNALPGVKEIGGRGAIMLVNSGHADERRARERITACSRPIARVDAGAERQPLRGRCLRRLNRATVQCSAIGLRCRWSCGGTSARGEDQEEDLAGEVGD